MFVHVQYVPLVHFSQTKFFFRKPAWHIEHSDGFVQLKQLLGQAKNNHLKNHIKYLLSHPETGLKFPEHTLRTHSSGFVNPRLNRQVAELHEAK